MRIKWFILLLTLTLSANHLYSQEVITDTRITSPAQRTTLKTYLSQLEETTNLKFSYSDNILPNDTLFIQAFSDVSLKHVLNSLLPTHNIGFKAIDKHIVLFQADTPQQEFILSGHISDSSNKERLIGVTVYITGTNFGTTTNTDGYFNLKIPAGEYVVKLSYIGYQSKTIPIKLTHNTAVDTNLSASSYQVSEVIVKSTPDNELIESVMMNTNALGISELRTIPGLLGENDVIKNINVLPGITLNEASSGSVFVRGGGSNQTVFLMDNAKIYNAGHFGGFFSVFNPDLVNKVEIHKSGLPIGETGAISSLIDVRLNEGNKKQWVTKGSIGLIDVKASIEGPVKKDKTSVLVGFRRTYIDAITKISGLDIEPSSTNFYFYDFNFKLSSILNKKNRIVVSGYTGTDSFTLFDEVKRSNYVASLRWNHIFNDRFYTTLTLTLSQNRMQQDYYDYRNKFLWKRKINTVDSRLNAHYLATTNLRINYGLAASATSIQPSQLIPKSNDASITTYNGINDNMLQVQGFGDIEWKITPKTNVSVGSNLVYFRIPEQDADAQTTSGKTDYSGLYIEPQLMVRFILNKRSSVKAAYKRQISALHQLEVSDIGITVNRWMPSSPAYQPARSDNYSLGYYFVNRWLKASCEIYYREMDHLIETLSDERVIYSIEPEQYLHSARGNSYGAEFLFTINHKKYTGIISYAYAKTTWKTTGINNDSPYPAMHDRPHTINIINSIRFTPRIDLTVNWNYSTGLPYTPTTGVYHTDGKAVIKYSENKINSQRLPAYHRLDIGFNIAARKNAIRRWKGFWNFSVYNAYFRKNPLGIVHYSPENMEEESSKFIYNPKYLYIYQFVPSISYKFKF